MSYGARDINRFWRKVNKTDSCWLWKGRPGTKGYGRFTIGRRGDSRTFMAHRFSYEVAFGVVPGELCVCHHCDTPACVKPAHLFLGTKADNNADMKRKGRHPLGDRHHRRKLNSEQVRAIKRDARPQVVIAAEYKVHQSTISFIKSGRYWKEVA